MIIPATWMATVRALSPVAARAIDCTLVYIVTIDADTLVLSESDLDVGVDDA